MPWWAWRSVHFGLALVASVLSIAGVVLSDRARELYGEPSYNNAYLASLALVFGWAGSRPSRDRSSIAASTACLPRFPPATSTTLCCPGKHVHHHGVSRLIRVSGGRCHRSTVCR